MKLEVVADAGKELQEIVNYYEQERLGLGRNFFDAATEATTEICRNPRLYAVFYRRYRMCRIEKFPYGVVYRIRRDGIRVLAFRHLSRGAEYWLSRDQT